MVGLSWTLLGMSMEEAIEEYLALPLKDSVKEKWLYSNAARVLGSNERRPPRGPGGHRRAPGDRRWP